MPGSHLVLSAATLWSILYASGNIPRSTPKTSSPSTPLRPFALAMHLAPDMVKRGWGRTISVTTSVGSMLRAGMGLFHHQRAAVHIFSADISDQRSQPLQGVRVCRE